ncbi:MAG: serine protease AprX [Actinomycetota bacterium]
MDAVLRASLTSGGVVRGVAAVSWPALPVQLTALRSIGLDATPYVNLPMVALQGPAAAFVAASQLPFVRSLWGDHPLEATLEQSTTMIQADDVYSPATCGCGVAGFTGHGVRIAILDSGIDATHPDLALGTKTVQNVKVLGYDKVFGSSLLTIEDQLNTDTTTGHGTHVAGIAAGSGGLSGGRYAGVAPGADLVGVGAADGLDMLTAISGYDWILGHRAQYGIKVINNSWADGKIAYDPNDPLNVASKSAHDAGITVVFAAGNDGKTSGNVYNRYAWPDWVIGVAGVDKLGVPGTYSSTGDAAHHATVSAPGSWIISTRAQTGVVSFPNQLPIDPTDPTNPRVVSPDLWPYYTAMVGTSMASPHVAGVVALVLEANPSLTPDQVKAAIASTTTPVAGCGVEDCGSGLVNALGAVRAALSMVNATPVASLSATPASGPAPLAVTLDGSASSDSDGSIVGYCWDFDGDGTIDTQTTTATVSHTYGAGDWHVGLTVIDDDGSTSTPTLVEVRSSNPPTARATVPSKAKGGTVVTLDATASSDSDGSIVSYQFTFGDGTQVVSTTPVVTHVWSPSRATTYGWTLVVTDDAGVRAGTQGTIKVTP